MQKVNICALTLYESSKFKPSHSIEQGSCVVVQLSCVWILLGLQSRLQVAQGQINETSSCNFPSEKLTLLRQRHCGKQILSTKTSGQRLVRGPLLLLQQALDKHTPSKECV
jgi:hypothetical protein